MIDRILAHAFIGARPALRPPAASVVPLTDRAAVDFNLRAADTLVSSSGCRPHISQPAPTPNPSAARISEHATDIFIRRI
ncbi:MAG TPA: hypothetical protein VG796_17120 [Verrucomicrobiales bacterium]|nr:hypothetical protein [Verrucomicrobiales bacterium]